MTYRVMIWKSEADAAWERETELFLPWSEGWELFAEAGGDRNEILKFLRKQAARIHKEPYMAPRFEGEEPLPGLEG